MRGRPALTVRVWTIWKHPTWGSTMAGTANAGIVVERISETAARLHASAGLGEPAFDDLLVRPGQDPARYRRRFADSSYTRSPGCTPARLPTPDSKVSASLNVSMLNPTST